MPHIDSHIYCFAIRVIRMNIIIDAFLLLLDEGIMVCEPGCSTGVLICYWAKRFPNSTFIGYDIDEKSVYKARKRAKEENITNVSFLVQDGCHLPSSWNRRFDLILSFLIVHDVPLAQSFLQGMKLSLKNGGCLIVVEARCKANLEDNKEIATARETFGYSLFHCLPVSLHHKKSEGIGLAWGVEHVEKALIDVGFKVVFIYECEDIFHPRAYFICLNSLK